MNCQLSDTSNSIDMGLLCLGLANSGINIFVYLATSHVLRQEFYKALYCLLSKQHPEQYGHTSVTATSVL